MTITDPFNSADAQNCSYVYDDLNRVQSVSCGTTWAQTFSYDAFGNIQKSGNSSFGANYNSKTNQMSMIGSSTPTYDANGDVTNDFAHTYAFDANGNPVTVDTVAVTYDAMARMVEQNRTGSYTEIVYSPSGAKLALMTGASTLQKGYVPLTSGTMAVYNSGGLAFYRHSDWLGSSRFASTTSRTMYFDGAYAPFGEPYATTGTTDLSYTGMQQDTSSNLYDFPARRYETNGRWPSPDPAGTGSANPMNPQSWNRYAYAFNNPLGFTDPTGTTPEGSGPTSDNCPTVVPVGVVDCVAAIAELASVAARTQERADQMRAHAGLPDKWNHVKSLVQALKQLKPLLNKVVKNCGKVAAAIIAIEAAQAAIEAAIAALAAAGVAATA